MGGLKVKGATHLALAHSGSIATARVASERAPDGFFMARHAAARLLHPRASPGAIDIPLRANGSRVMLVDTKMGRRNKPRRRRASYYLE